jgi:membrane protein YqaA with SNARE-associated domain
MFDEPALARPATSTDVPRPIAHRATGSPWPSILLLLTTLVLTVGLAFVPAGLVARLGNYGYLGVFLLTLLASATIVLPSPAIGVALLAGKTLDPWLVGLVSGMAAGLGEITGYMAGLGGSAFAARSRFYPTIEHWVERWGLVPIFVLALIPGPFFDLAGIAAGTLRMPFRRFLLVCMLGKTLRFIGVAWVGYFLGTARIL